jgi:hypothetical protein
MTLTLNQSTTPASAAWSTDPAMENASAATISGRAWACAIRFNAVASRTSQTASKFEDQLARFNIWAANLGVFAEAHASLDYRLRDSPKVKALMMQQLQALQRKLQSGTYLPYFLPVFLLFSFTDRPSIGHCGKGRRGLLRPQLTGCREYEIR